ncbi:MAG: hypothetical protein VX195_10095 [Pseudomonadota bacterium]|nr:hypothetical protein [Pseudomonadota bacterium]
MQLPASMTFAAVEDFLGSAVVEEEVLLPTNGKHQAAGAEGAIVQALATWVNAKGRANVRTYAESRDDDQIEKLVRRLYGLSAFALADRIATLTNEDVTDHARAMAMTRIKRLSREDVAGSRGPQVEIVCADHLAMSHPASFYTVDEDGLAKVKDLPSFMKLVDDAIIGRLIGKSYRRNLSRQFERTLATALHELIRNTDEHARMDDRGDIRRKSIRGLQAKKHLLKPERLAVITDASPPLNTYCRRLLPARADNSLVQLIEISVFDTGPGLASSLTGIPLAELSAEEELQAVRRCFAKNVSRKHASSSGLGLPNIAKSLTEAGGFMRLRTGRCALFSDFNEDPVSQFGDLPYLRNWFEDDGQAAPVAGTLFTLIFPLKA